MKILLLGFFVVSTAHAACPELAGKYGSCKNLHTGKDVPVTFTIAQTNTRGSAAPTYSIVRRELSGEDQAQSWVTEPGMGESVRSIPGRRSYQQRITSRCEADGVLYLESVDVVTGEGGTALERGGAWPMAMDLWRHRSALFVTTDIGMNIEELRCHKQY